MPNGSWVQQTSYGIVGYIWRGLTSEWSDVIWRWFSKLFGSPVAVIEDLTAQRLIQLTVAMVLAGLPVLIGWYVLKETLSRMDGTSTAPPEALIRRVMVTGVAVTGTSLMAWFLATLADRLRELLAGFGLQISLIQDYFFAPGSVTASAVMLTLIFLICALILTVQRWVLAAELTVLTVIGPIMAAGLIRDGHSTTFNVWMREVVAVLLTPLIQMVVRQLFLRQFGSNNGILEIGDRLASLAYLYVIWNSPRWARQMVYNVGAGDTVASAAGAAGRMAVARLLMKATFKK